MRRTVCPILIAVSLAAGCASAPTVKYATDPKSGETIEYLSASDGRSWVDRNPAVGAPVGVVEVIAMPVLQATALVIYFASFMIPRGTGV